MLWRALGDDWFPEFWMSPLGTIEGIVSMRVDLANPAMKVAVEVDDPGHVLRVRREKDQLRDAWLISQGWIVLRFSDAEILDGLTSVMSTVMSSCGI